jgi:RNA polymerase sigma factor (sigma-70 family)
VSGRLREDGAARLVVAAQQGDAFAMDELITLLTPYVGRICASVAPDDAADAMQEVFIAVFRSIGGLKSPESLIGWVRVIAVRESVRIAKERKREVALPDLNDIPSAEDPALTGDVQDVLRRLSPQQRAVLLLRHVDGLDEREVARMLQLPVGTVRSRLFRARESFRLYWS